MFKRFKSIDLLVVIFTLLISLFFFLLGYSSNGDAVEVTVDGKAYCSYSLYEDRNIYVETENGGIVVCIEKGKVYVKDADCKDKQCVKEKYISYKGQTILCLPLKVMIKIGGTKYEYTY